MKYPPAPAFHALHLLFDDRKLGRNLYVIPRQLIVWSMAQPMLAEANVHKGSLTSGRSVLTMAGPRITGPNDLHPASHFCNPYTKGMQEDAPNPVDVAPQHCEHMSLSAVGIQPGAAMCVNATRLWTMVPS
eukprot:2554147-Karenia_brevis.AAC.1